MEVEKWHEIQPLSNDQELLTITMEECAEVQQACAKLIRFGLETGWNGDLTITQLEQEIGDLICMFDMMSDREWIQWDRVHKYAEKKAEKLKTWSNLNEH